MSLLVTKWEETFPVFVRRRQFFELDQKSGQSWVDFATSLDMLGGEANLSGLKTEDIIVFRLIGGCKDSFLKEKFLKLKNPTLAELKKEATEWEGVRRSMGTTKLQASESQARWQPQSKYSKSKNGPKNASRPSNSSPHKSTQLPQGACKRCGYPKHDPAGRPCPAIEKYCDACGTKGHFSSVRGGPNNGTVICNKKQSQGSGQKKKGQNARQKQRRLAQEEEEIDSFQQLTLSESSAANLKPEWSVTNYDERNSRFTALQQERQ